MLNRIPVSKGDFIHIKSGTVHALLEGIIICEIQENSDNIYRLYDWYDIDRDRKLRPLHIEKALDAINFPPAKSYDKYMSDILIKYDKSKVNSAISLVQARHFNIDYF